MQARLDRVALSGWFMDALLFVICGGVVLAAMLLTPSDEAVSLFGREIPVVCFYRQFLDMRCPGCGLTRSFAFMGHGQALEAFRMNFLGPPLFVLVASQVPWRLVQLVRRGRRLWVGGDA